MLVAAVSATKPFAPGSFTSTTPFSGAAVALVPMTGGFVPMTGGGGVCELAVSEDDASTEGPAPVAGFVTSARVTVTMSPGAIVSVQQSETVSVAFAFVRTPERLNVALVVTS